MTKIDIEIIQPPAPPKSEPREWYANLINSKLLAHSGRIYTDMGTADKYRESASERALVREVIPEPPPVDYEARKARVGERDLFLFGGTLHQRLGRSAVLDLSTGYIQSLIWPDYEARYVILVRSVKIIVEVEP